MARRKGTGDNTVFDDVYRTMVQKMPTLLPPLINEVFGTNYPENAEIIQRRNEFLEQKGKIITDSVFQIEGSTYHVECQSTPDGTMVIRMLEYDFAIALDDVILHGNGSIDMRLPYSTVLYLRHNAETPAFLQMNLIDQDEDELTYRVPIIKVQDFTKDAIFEKHLLILLPFYILRYEKCLNEFEGNDRKLQQLLAEYEDIRKRLEAELIDKEKSVLYMDLISNIKRIADYLTKKQPRTRRELKKVMGGEILELESERLERIGHRKGLKEGLEQGIKRGLQEGEQNGLRKGLQEGEQNKATETIRKMIDRGYSDEQILDLFSKEELAAAREKITE